ncbi:MAG: acyl-CoA synthetase [Mycobacteriales bacterium]
MTATGAVARVAELRERFSWDEVLARFDWDPRERFNISHEACARWAGHRGRVAMIVEGVDGGVRTLTYHELDRLANRFANALVRLGVRRGDRVAAVLPRTTEAFVTALAVWKVGAVHVPIFAGFGPDAVRYRLEDSTPRLLVTDGPHRALVGQSLTSDVEVVTVTGARGAGLVRGDYSFWAEADRSAPTFETVETAPTETAALVYTSGTTGPPKGCILPHAGLISLVPFVEHVMDLREDDLLWATADPSWSFGLFSTGMVPMALGHPRLVYEGDFDPARWWAVAERHQVTHLTAAPTAYRLLAAGRDRDLHGRDLALRAATSAGEPLNPEPMQWFDERLGVPIADAYGLTEVGFALGNLRSAGHPVKSGAVGFAMPGFEVRLLRADGTEAGVGETGTIAVRGHEWFLGAGYWGKADAWSQRWEDGWFVTGDAAYRDEDGYHWFVGRADDVIVTSGYNVGPFEVESALLLHPAVAEAAVVGKPDQRRGSSVQAFVVLAPDASPSDLVRSELQAIVVDKVGRHASPREIDFVDDLPRTTTGKLQRAELRRRAAAESTRP